MSTLTQNYPFWCLLILLILAFMTGGGARSDIQSLAILRPASALFLGIGLWSLSLAQVRSYRFLLGMAVAMIVLTLIQEIPLPPSIWSVLPGREFAAEISQVVEIGEVSRPVSLTPLGTWNSLYSLFVPLSVLVLALQITREQRFQLLTVVISLGMLSGFLGLLQAVGPDEGSLYLYRVTNAGSAVGLFSNRNHQAVFLASLFPMLAVFAAAGIRAVEQAKLFGGLAIGAGTILVPLLLVTGSRAGLIGGMLGILFALLLYRRPEIDQLAKLRTRRFNPRLLFGGLGVTALGVVTFLMARAEAFDRLFVEDETGDLRFRIWGPIAEMTATYFPLGSGAGSFVEIYQVADPYALLKINHVNHAHNDWLEILFDTGLPGLTLAGLAVGAFALAGRKILRDQLESRRDDVYARLGMVVVLLFALASIVDYPLRVPSLACIFTLAAVWMASAGNPHRKSAGTN